MLSTASWIDFGASSAAGIGVGAGAGFTAGLGVGGMNDDASVNEPIPAGRNLLAVKDICAATAGSQYFDGLHTDFYILQTSSNLRDAASGKKLGDALRSGSPYTGYYAQPLEEIRQIFAKENPCAQ